jgi:uncharacterized protein (UPF0276 family)
LPICDRLAMNPICAGLGLKPQHFAAARHCDAPGLWFEVHPENYMVDGGPRLAWLDAIRRDHPLSLHGVALSLAADADPDPQHLDRLARLAERFAPPLLSEHLAWSTWRGAYRPDLLPVPRTAEALARIAANIGRTQDRLRRRIAIENPSHYLRFDGHEFGEVEFLAEIARRSGCALLLDVNNVFVSASNLGESPAQTIDAVPGELIAEIHLAGHSVDPVHGERLLVDSHDAPVAEPVWRLYRRLVERIGPRPTLIERDENIPPFAELLAERNRAEDVLLAAARLPEAA